MASIYQRSHELLAQAQAAEREGDLKLGRKLRDQSNAEYEKVRRARDAEKAERDRKYRRTHPIPARAGRLTDDR